ncbi:MAG: asparaginase [Prochlorotrichaceae cyanobacterium]|jgi:L-asparaginase
MNLGKRSQTTQPLEVQLLREGIVESTHEVEAVVCDDRGRSLMVAGDPETGTFIRSALKPFQALAVTTTGTLDSFNLSDRDLAIICSSHRGAVEQARQCFNVLWQSDVDPCCLQCPIPEGKRSALEHNCSGKHAGMLAVCKHRGWSLNDYLRRKHPLQQLIVSQIAELLQMPAAELIVAQDDCGAPTYFMPLYQMATLYARLTAGNNLDMERIVRAMTHHPALVSGEGSFDTELMRLSGGQVVSKAGAEGIQCVGRIREGLGLAIKVKDGARRAKYAAAIQILKRLGWITPATAESLSDQFMTIDSIKRLDVLGDMSF